MTDEIRVVLVHDHPALLAGLRVFLDAVQDIVVVGEAATGKDALALIEAQLPDVVILDCVLSRMPGAEIAAQIARRGWPTRVLAFTAYADDESIQEMFQAGATDYLLKIKRFDTLIEAIRATAVGNGYYSMSIVDRIIALRTETAPGDLTRRERHVLALVAQGKTNREIARQLGITERTVEFHMSNILEKLDVASRVEAAIWFRSHA